MPTMMNHYNSTVLLMNWKALNKNWTQKTLKMNISEQKEGKTLKGRTLETVNILVNQGTHMTRDLYKIVPMKKVTTFVTKILQLKNKLHTTSKVSNHLRDLETMCGTSI
uniref:Uncharacterized protein n=1 Tax=Cacopsylla melanoneura TaxID=428564 RepID=A0A8D8Z4N8_9HEMI